MNACKVLVLCAAVFAAISCVDASRHVVCKDANDNPDLSEEDMDSHEEIWTTENGVPTLYCWHGCCGEKWGKYLHCCPEPGKDWEGDWDDWEHEWDKHHGSREHGSHESGSGSGSHERGKHGHHRKALTIVAIVAGVLAVGTMVLVACVCVLKKKVRAAHRIQNTRNTFNIIPGPMVPGNEKKQPLPEGDKSGTNPTLNNPYVIAGVPPPAYGISPDAPNTPNAPEYPPSYSTLSLRRAAQEQPETGGVQLVKPAASGDQMA